MWQARSVLGRRQVLLAAAAGVGGAVVVPLAGCAPKSGQGGPDPLVNLVLSARSDVTSAHALLTAFGADAAVTEVANARQAQADAMQREIDRLAGTTTPPPPPPPGSHAQHAAKSKKTAISALSDSLTSAQHAAAALVPTLPRYRAGLVGSVAAGCAGLVMELS